MQQLPHGPRSGGRRPVAAVIAIVVLAAVFLTVYLVRGRMRSVPQRPASPSSSQATDRPLATATTAAGSGGATRCASGQGGPLRQDAQFTATDDARTVVRYSISLPEDYYSACKQYPVLYALHGKNQNHAGFLDEALSMRKAMTAGALDQSIIVTPDSYSTGRWENRDTGPAEDNFIQYLIPHIEQNYRVKPGPSYRLLVGFSMGGHGAIRFGLKYPDMFAAVWSVDGAMADTEDYLPFIEGKSSDDFHIIVVGGRLNGDRVRALVGGLKQRGVEIPYTYQDLEHEFVTFVEEDEREGWQAMKYLQQHLGPGVS